jgi:hypothetical protein
MTGLFPCKYSTLFKRLWVLAPHVLGILSNYVETGCFEACSASMRFSCLWLSPCYYSFYRSLLHICPKRLHLLFQLSRNQFVYIHSQIAYSFTVVNSHNTVSPTVRIRSPLYFLTAPILLRISQPVRFPGPFIPRCVQESTNSGFPQELPRTLPRRKPGTRSALKHWMTA